MGAVADPMDLLAAFERAGDAVYAVDHRQRIVHWSKAAERLLGYRPEQVIGKQCFDVIAGGDRRGHPFCRSDCPVIECARKGRPTKAYEIATQTKSGLARWLSVSIVVLPGRDAKSVLAVHLVRDVTEQRRVEMRAERVLASVASVAPPASDADT